MSEDEKKSEIADRIARLSEIRSDLSVARSRLSAAYSHIVQAGVYYARLTKAPSPKHPSKPDEWPSLGEIESADDQVKTLKGEAAKLIRELKELGIDENLFKINGE